VQAVTTNSPYSLLRAIRPRGRSRHLAVLAQPVQGLMLTEAAQFEMADFKTGAAILRQSTSHEQWPANILAEEFQPAEDVDVAPDGGKSSDCQSQYCRMRITIVPEQYRFGNMSAGPRAVKPGAQQRCLRRNQGRTHRPAPIIAGDWKDRDEPQSPIYFRMSPPLPMTPGDDQIEDSI